MTIEEYYIGFFKYTDTTTWMVTGIRKTEQELLDYFASLDYINKDTIQIRKIQLPKI